MSIREEYDFKKMEGKKNPHKVGEKCEPPPPGDGICYYCGKMTNSLSISPSQWNVSLCHGDEPGKVKHHHTGCVTERLLENQPIEPKPKLPERFGLSEMNDADYQIMKTINELIEYLRGRE